MKSIYRSPVSHLLALISASLLIAIPSNQASVWAQENPKPTDAAVPDVTQSIQEAVSSLDEIDREKYYTSIRVPDGLIEIAPAKDHVDLFVHNRFITRLRATILSNSPAARAAGIVEELSNLADQDRISPIETFTLEQGVLFVVADQAVFAIAHKDLDLIVGETIEQRTAEAYSNLERVLPEMVELHDPEILIEGVVKNSIALLLFGLIIWILQRLKNWIDRKLLPTLDRRMRISLSKHIGEGARKEIRFLNILRTLLNLMLWVVFLGVTYVWFSFSLEQFPYTRPWGESLGQQLVDLLAWLGDGVARAIPGLFIVFVVFLLARAASRAIRALFDAIEAGRIELPGLHPETAQPTRRLTIVGIWLVAIVVAYPYFPGSNTAAFKGLSVFAGLVISLGSTGIVNQAMSGLMLMYARALRPGDFVQVGDVEGTVTQLGMLSTKIRTLRNEEITVPNAVVVSRETTNYSRFEREGVAISTTVTIGYDTPWRTVHSLLEAAAEKTPGLRDVPKPFVLQTALADHYPEYRLMAVIDHPEQRGRVLSNLHENIQDLFHQNGVQIMSPHYVADPPEPIIGATDKT